MRALRAGALIRGASLAGCEEAVESQETAPPVDLRRHVEVGAMVLASVLAAACGKEMSSPAPVLEEASTAMASDVLGLGLERPHTGLVFSHADIGPCDDTKEGHFLSLGNGWILAAATLQQHFESLTCYLELEQGPGGWEPRAVGLSYAFCVGRFWCEELSGTVTLDQDDPQELVIHAALRGRPLQHEKEYVQTFRVDLREESVGLRRSLPRPRGGSGRSR